MATLLGPDQGPDPVSYTHLDVYKRQTNLRAVAPRMISGHIQGRLLEMLVRMLRPRRALEIGTFTGYSALSMAAGLEEGAELHTVEVDDEQKEFIRSYFARSPHGRKITLHIGSALDIVPKLGGEFDLAFIDGDKREYPDYYRMLMGDDGGRPLVHSGSVLIADNILWSGKVVQPLSLIHISATTTDRYVTPG